MDRKSFLNYFLNVPVAVNNLYGDPFSPIQKENTFNKLEKLKETNHRGIVGIITKTELNKDEVKRLKELNEYLNLIILVSCSELPYEIEKVGGNRYNSLSGCVQAGIPVIAYVRPFIPEYNTKREVIEEIFKKVHDSGCKRVVVSGLRGTDEMLKDSNIKSEELKNWSLRVKIIPSNIRDYIDKFSSQYNLKVYDRTSCGISAELGLSHSYNPYYHSPQLAKCNRCELKNTCFDNQQLFIPTSEDIEFIKLLGYHPKIANEGQFEICKVDPLKRMECVSCCTCCFMLKRYSIELTDKNICLGDLGLLRLLTHKLVFKKGIIDRGEKDIAKPKNPLLNSSNLYILNSWWSYSRNVSSCYNCSYCIVKHYNKEKENGFNEECGDVPLHVGEKIWNERERRIKNEK